MGSERSLRLWEQWKPSMPDRRPEYTRPYSAEYQQASGHPVARMFDGPYREFVSEPYVAWLEDELFPGAGKRERSTQWNW